MMQKALFGCLLILGGMTSPAYAEQPLEVIQRGIDRGIQILIDSQYADPDRKDLQHRKLWELCQQVFNFEEFSRRVLASNWKKFTAPQRDQFVALFSEFLAELYLRKLQQIYNNEKVIYNHQEMTGGSTAVVAITIVWQNIEVPLEIHMIKRQGIWKAYDVGAFGVSAVIFYRQQFKALLERESPEQVILRLKKKIAELEAAS